MTSIRHAGEYEIIQMVQYRRNKLETPDAVYFLTICTDYRYPWFKCRQNAEICRCAMEYAIDRYTADVIAWVILPDHIHWLIVPDYSDYSNIVFAFKCRITARLRHLPGIKSNVIIWQDGFWERTVINEIELSAYTDYIHFNPVKHGYVDSPDDWQFSSFKSYIKLGYYEEDWQYREDIVIETGE
jgi:putative transposase